MSEGKKRMGRLREEKRGEKKGKRDE